MTRSAPPRSALAIFAAAASLAIVSHARADDPTCDYDVTVLDSHAAKLDISVACDPALEITRFTALGNRDHWWTDPDGYKDGKGRFPGRIHTLHMRGHLLRSRNKVMLELND